MKRYDDCTKGDGVCTTCSLVNYGRDCHNNPINVVAYRRHVLGLTQAELGKLIGKNFKYIQRLEYGERSTANLTLRMALALADALEIDPRELLPAE